MKIAIITDNIYYYDGVSFFFPDAILITPSQPLNVEDILPIIKKSNCVIISCSQVLTPHLFGFIRNYYNGIIIIESPHFFSSDHSCKVRKYKNTYVINKSITINGLKTMLINLNSNQFEYEELRFTGIYFKTWHAMIYLLLYKRAKYVPGYTGLSEKYISSLKQKFTQQLDLKKTNNANEYYVIYLVCIFHMSDVFTGCDYISDDFLSLQNKYYSLIST